MLMPVRFKGHCSQIHPLSVQQPLCSNMLRPSARKRLLTASKFPASPPSPRQRIRLPFFKKLSLADLCGKAKSKARCGCCSEPVCATSVLINLSPESGTLSSNPEVTQTAIHPQTKHRQQFGQLAVYKSKLCFQR